MKIAIGIVQALMIILFLVVGVPKVIIPYQDLVQQDGMAWVEEFSETQVKIIGALEVLGALGLLIPWILKKYRFLVPLASIGLVLTMIGAVIVHSGREESIIFPLVIFVILLFLSFKRLTWFKGDKLE